MYEKPNFIYTLLLMGVNKDKYKDISYNELIKLSIKQQMEANNEKD